jgi:hypothetical protein
MALREARVHSHWWRLLSPFLGVLHNLWPLLLGGGAGGGALWQKLRQRRAAAWPSADGEVLHADVRHKQGYLVVVEYRYYARSEYRYGKYSRHFRRKKAAEQFADALHGRHLQVRYQADKPEISVVLEDDLRMTGALLAG